jgi:hypothetical protein
MNERQRAYLRAIFDTDQSVEADTRAIWRFETRPKASDWRWLEYSEPIAEIGKPASRLYAAIKKSARIDQGTGSTFQALADRGLIQVRVRGLNNYAHIRMTPAGRKLVRSWTGQRAYKAPPAGTLREWHWRALARAYAAGDAGLGDEDGSIWYAYIGWNTWLRLREYKGGGLVEERPHPQPPIETDQGMLSLAPKYRMHITAAGRALYEFEWARCRELYPDVDAPEPAVLMERSTSSSSGLNTGASS